MCPDPGWGRPQTPPGGVSQEGQPEEQLASARRQCRQGASLLRPGPWGTASHSPAAASPAQLRPRAHAPARGSLCPGTHQPRPQNAPVALPGVAHIRVVDLVLVGLLVQEVEHVLDGQRQGRAPVRRAEDGLKQIIHKLLQRALYASEGTELQGGCQGGRGGWPQPPGQGEDEGFALGLAF